MKVYAVEETLDYYPNILEYYVNLEQAILHFNSNVQSYANSKNLAKQEDMLEEDAEPLKISRENGLPKVEAILWGEVSFEGESDMMTAITLIREIKVSSSFESYKLEKMEELKNGKLISKSFGA